MSLSPNEYDPLMAYRSVVDPDVVQEHLSDQTWVVLDARFDIDDEARAGEDFLEGHIAGAQFADLAEHMAGEIVPGKTGRRPLPRPEAFAEQARAWGIGPGVQVVVYDDMDGIMAAARLWLLLKWIGHDSVAVLDRGWSGWLADGRPVAREVKGRERGSLVLDLRPHVMASLEDAISASEREDVLLFDSRSVSDGVPSHDAIRGRIPSSGFADRAFLTRRDGSWRSPEELRMHFEGLLRGTDPSQVIFYCGSGVTAAKNLVGMAHAGLDGSRMYVGSWSEWILDPSRPRMDYEDPRPLYPPMA